MIYYNFLIILFIVCYILLCELYNAMEHLVDCHRMLMVQWTTVLETDFRQFLMIALEYSG